MARRLIELDDGQSGETLFSRIRYLRSEQQLDLELIEEYCESLQQCRTLRDLGEFDAWIADNLVELWQFEIDGGSDHQQRRAI